MDLNQLVSLALFKDMYNQGKDIYQIIGYFIKDCLYKKGNLSIYDLRTELQSVFGFELPLAVVNAAVKRNKQDIKKKDGELYIENTKGYKSILLSEKASKEIQFCNDLLTSLRDFIIRKEGLSESDIDERLVLDNLCAYLLKKNNNDILYYKHIVSFICENNNENIKDTLQDIFDGSVILIGLQYQNNTDEIYRLKSDLTIYLDMEWLFSAYGYNGSLLQEIFLKDFIPLVKEINQKKGKGRVILSIVPKVITDINNFFLKAEEVLEEGKFRENSAMKMILDKCHSISDVVVEKNKFLNFLRELDISVDDNAHSVDLSHEPNHKYNLDNLQSRNSFSFLSEKELDENFSILNTINKLRMDAKVYGNVNFEDVRYIFITATKSLINLSKDNKIKNKYDIPLALDIGFVINRLWFKLQKSFVNDRPLSLDVIVNAKIALDSMVSDKLQLIYHELMSKFNNGEISRESATQLISLFREKEKCKIDNELSDTSFIFEDDIKKSIEELSSKERELKKLSESNMDKDVKIESLVAEKSSLEDKYNDSMRLLDSYKSKEKRKNEIKNKIKNKLKFSFKVGVGMFFLYLIFEYLFPLYEKEMGYLSILITIISFFSKK